MNSYITHLKKQLLEQPLNYGYQDAKSLLDMLYCCYSENNPIGDSSIRKSFSVLDSYLSRLTLAENDLITDTVCDLCLQHERLAFLAGIRIGVLLFSELEASP